MGPCWTMLVQDGGRTMRIRGGLDEVYVGYVEPWKIPIGEDDTQEWPIWVFYREWLYWRERWLKSLAEN